MDGSTLEYLRQSDDRHAKALQHLMRAFHGSPDHYLLAANQFRKCLSDDELKHMVVALCLAMDLKNATSVCQAILKGFDFPDDSPALLPLTDDELRDKADWWALYKNERELGSYAGAAYRRMQAKTRKAFKQFIRSHG